MNNDFLINIIICFLLSFLIGIERQYRRRIVGLRTSILVSIGSFLFVSMSFLINKDSVDVTRIAAQVVCGIGFLGAGVIIKDGMKVRGLTTAATLWCDAAIGVLCASGLIMEALCGTTIILFSNIVLRYINRLIDNLSSKSHTQEKYRFKIEADSKKIIAIKEYIDTFIKSNLLSGITTNDIMMKTDNKKGSLSICLVVFQKHNSYIDKLVEQLNSNFVMNSFEYYKDLEILKDDEEI